MSLRSAHSFLPSRWGLIGMLALATLFAATELFPVHLHFAGNSHSFSLCEIPACLGLFFMPGSHLLIAHAVGGGAGLLIRRRQRGLKLLFNVALFVVGDRAALGVFHVMAGRNEGFSTTSALAAAAGTVVASILSAMTVSVIISVVEQRWRDRRLLSSISFGAVNAVVSTSLGLIAVAVLSAYPTTAWLLVVPTTGLYLANHAYATERRRHLGLAFLHDSTKLLHQSAELDTALVELLAHMQDAFRAGFAELVYIPSGSDIAMTVVATGSKIGNRTEPMAGSDVELLIGFLATSTGPIVTGAGRPSSATVSAVLASRGLTDAVIAPLRADGRACGVLIVGNRLGDVTRFDHEDAVLLETLADNVAAALENGRLEQSLEQLRRLEGKLTHQATHDSLTGLANRALFAQTVTESLAQGSNDSPVAVLFIDLDDFKTVNDSLGHAAGDELLVVLGRRLAAAMNEGATAARLGGDEFAVALPGVGNTDEVRSIAEALLTTIGAPVAIMGRIVPVHASIGAAVSTPGQSSADLLRNADTAMYAAKGQGKHRVAVFEASQHEAAVHRYNLTFELHRAVKDNEFVVHYQPIVELANGSIEGAEALVRWKHPKLGLLPPGAFIAIAEESDAITQISRAVLDSVCRFLLDYQPRGSNGSPLRVAVNLSARDLFDRGFVGDVEHMIERYGVDPAQLVFEITEGAMIADPHGASQSLATLRRLGVLVALDDFGTGYSSLSQLSRLPVDILKIAQPFVDDMYSGCGPTALVEAIVRLGQTLGLTLVAEGIEHCEQADALAGLGCALGQGYYFSPPVPEPIFVQRFDHQHVSPFPRR